MEETMVAQAPKSAIQNCPHGHIREPRLALRMYTNTTSVGCHPNSRTVEACPVCGALSCTDLTPYIGGTLLPGRAKGMETSRGWAGWQSFNLDFLAEAVGIRRGQLAAEPVA